MIRTNSLLQIMHVNLDRNSSSTDEFVLAAKFLTKRVLNVEATGRTFKPLWNTRRDFMIRDVGNQVILFLFLKRKMIQNGY